MPPLHQPELKNAILARLRPDDFAALRGQLERVAMPSGGILQRAGEPAKSIYFAEAGVISLLAPLEQGGESRSAISGAKARQVFTLHWAPRH